MQRRTRHDEGQRNVARATRKQKTTTRERGAQTGRAGNTDKLGELRATSARRDELGEEAERAQGSMPCAAVGTAAAARRDRDHEFGKGAPWEPCATGELRRRAGTQGRAVKSQARRWEPATASIGTRLRAACAQRARPGAASWGLSAVRARKSRKAQGEATELGNSTARRRRG